MVNESCNWLLHRGEDKQPAAMWIHIGQWCSLVFAPKGSGLVDPRFKRLTHQLWFDDGRDPWYPAHTKSLVELWPKNARKFAVELVCEGACYNISMYMYTDTFVCQKIFRYTLQSRRSAQFSHAKLCKEYLWYRFLKAFDVRRAMDTQFLFTKLAPLVKPRVGHQWLMSWDVRILHMTLSP